MQAHEIAEKAATDLDGTRTQATACESGPSLSRVDILEYMSDLMAELKNLSDQHAWRALSGYLTLAQAEALSRRDQLMSQGSRSAAI